MEIIVAFAVGLVILGLVMKLISLPFRMVWKFITNSIAGAVMLWIAQIVFVQIQINILSALIAGIFGIPGVIAVILYNYI